MRLRRIIMYGVLAAALTGALAYAFLPRPVPVDLATIEQGTLTVTIDGDGKTRVREVYVVSAPLHGTVMRIERHVGDEVVASDTVLARIKPTDPTFLDRRARAQAQAAIKAAEAAYKLAEAERARAVAELEFARSDLRRTQELAQRGTVSQRDLDQAQLVYRTKVAALDTAKATVEMRRFELETARAALIEPGGLGDDGMERTCCIDVFSPVDGTVLRVMHESESVVAAGTPLLEVGDPADLEIVVDLLSSEAVRVRQGAPVTIEDWGGSVSLQGKVRRVEPFAFTKVSALGIEEQRANVIIDFTGPRKSWKGLGHGYRVQAEILDWRGDDVIKVPMGALFRDGDAWAVFIASDGAAALTHVEIGHSNGEEAEILNGIAVGDRVILHPGDQVADGVSIEARSQG